MKVTDLEPSEYHEYYKGYIESVPKDLTLLEGLNKGAEMVLEYFNSIPKDKLEYRYEAGKWTIKEVFQHIVDTERVLFYRCFTIGRHDKTNLPGFEQDDYVEPSKANSKSLETIIAEYEAVRNNTMVLIKSLSDEDFKFMGTVSGGDMSSRAAAFIILGHERHHVNVIKARYL